MARPNKFPYASRDERWAEARLIPPEFDDVDDSGMLERIAAVGCSCDRDEMWPPRSGDSLRLFAARNRFYYIDDADRERLAATKAANEQAKAEALFAQRAQERADREAARVKRHAEIMAAANTPGSSIWELWQRAAVVWANPAKPVWPNEE